MTPEQAQEITRLRSLNLSPKQIARNLGLRPAEVTEFIRNQAEEATREREARGELAPLEKCLINEGGFRHFFGASQTGLFQKRDDDDDNEQGLAQIFVLRQDRSRYLLGSYLIDYWCLGVKDSFGPRKIDKTRCEGMIRIAYDSFEEDAQEITLEQAQAIIFNAIDYAAKLGIQPHRDFEESKQLLGPRPDLLPDLKSKFGKDGKPFYVSGPYDRPEKIIATLSKHVGEGNFEYVINIGGDDW